MGHRLSLHKGLCKNFHGHNYKVIVGIKSEELNDNGMVMDFGEMKWIVREYTTSLDHALMVNSSDKYLLGRLLDVLPELKVLAVPYEPTAEHMSREIYEHVDSKIKKPLQMDYVTVYETDTSQATYTEY